jgi:hypothetical protein
MVGGPVVYCKPFLKIMNWRGALTRREVLSSSANGKYNVNENSYCTASEEEKNCHFKVRNRVSSIQSLFKLQALYQQ